MLDGRVKTLHPKFILEYYLTEKKTQKEMKKQNFHPIDLVVVNFYPFQREFFKKHPIIIKLLKI